MEKLNEHDEAILNCVFNPHLPLETPAILEDVDDDTPQEIKQMEIEAVNLVEKCQLEQALALLNQAIEKAPNRASLYNNRGQVYQFQKKFPEAFDDVTKAIQLADPEKAKRTLAQAHCQRGILLRRDGKVDEAREEFQVAAKMGSHFAKSQLVELNPYAALCNQMLKNVMEMYNPNTI